ncbi:MAG TPA: hypothetical protein VGM32_12510 [Rhodopila sp.]
MFRGETRRNGGTLITKAGEAHAQTVWDLYGKVSGSKYSNVIFDPGDRITPITPVGGYGNPRDRDPARLAEDVREGYVSEAAADTLNRTALAAE